jgi:transposase
MTKSPSLDRFGRTAALAAAGTATDPQLLVALWLYATVDGVGNGRTLDRLCREHDAYKWLCGGVALTARGGG